jgi:argininosuccinate lyase
VTELADTLARDHRLPFKAGHAIASRLVASARKMPDRPLSLILRDVSKDVTGREVVYEEAALAEILSPQHFVSVRKTPGGPAPSETLRAIVVSEESLRVDEEWLADVRARLARAQQQLKEVSARL